MHDHVKFRYNGPKLEFSYSAPGWSKWLPYILLVGIVLFAFSPQKLIGALLFLVSVLLQVQSWRTATEVRAWKRIIKAMKEKVCCDAIDVVEDFWKTMWPIEKGSILRETTPDLLKLLDEKCDEYRTRVLALIVSNANSYLKSDEVLLEAGFRAIFLRPQVDSVKNGDTAGTLEFDVFFPPELEPKSRKDGQAQALLLPPKDHLHPGTVVKCLLDQEIRVADDLQEDDPYFLKLLRDPSEHRAGATIGVPLFPRVRKGVARVDFGVLWIDTGCKGYWSKLWPRNKFSDLWQSVERNGEQCNREDTDWGRLRLGELLFGLFKPLVNVLLLICTVQHFGHLFLHGEGCFPDASRFKIAKGGD